MSSSEDERDKELFTARPPPGSDASDVYSASTVAGQAPADLLDLVRSAEEAATVATSRRPQVQSQQASTAAPPPLQPAPTKDEEFVDVDGEAIDAPPSLPPFRSPTPGQELKLQDIPKPQPAEEEERVSAVPPSAITKKTPVPVVAAPRAKAATTSSPAKLERVERSTFPPAVSILLILALTAAVLFLLTR